MGEETGNQRDIRHTEDRRSLYLESAPWTFELDALLLPLSSDDWLEFKQRSKLITLELGVEDDRDLVLGPGDGHVRVLRGGEQLRWDGMRERQPDELERPRVQVESQVGEGLVEVGGHVGR